MVYEMRVYTVVPGKVAEFQALFESEALPAIRKYSRLIGWRSTDNDEMIHIWAYDDIGARERNRDAQGRDPQVIAFRRKIQPLLRAQENKILMPARFSPLR